LYAPAASIGEEEKYKQVTPRQLDLPDELPKDISLILPKLRTKLVQQHTGKDKDKQATLSFAKAISGLMSIGAISNKEARNAEFKPLARDNTVGYLSHNASARSLAPPGE
jgi:hypothetical protein